MSLLGAILSKLQTTSTVVNDIWTVVSAPPGTSSVIKTIQQGSVSCTGSWTINAYFSGLIASGSTVISAVNTAKAYVIFNGYTLNIPSPFVPLANAGCITSLGSTSVSAQLSLSGSSGSSNGSYSGVVYFTVVEYN